MDETLEEFEIRRRKLAFENWCNLTTLDREDGTWTLTHPDGGTIELLEGDATPHKYAVRIGNTEEYFRTLQTAQWYLWDNWSEANHF